MKTAGDVMHPFVHAVSPATTVAAATAKMQDQHSHSLIVERDGATDAFGIITSTDVIRKVIAAGKNPASVRVRDVMSKPIITIPPDCTLFDVAQLMARNHINHLPVFDGQKLIGMVSSTDIFNVK